MPSFEIHWFLWLPGGVSMGDYNETIKDVEKMGGSLKPRGQMAAF